LRSRTMGFEKIRLGNRSLLFVTVELLGLFFQLAIWADDLAHDARILFGMRLRLPKLRFNTTIRESSYLRIVGATQKLWFFSLVAPKVGIKFTNSEKVNYIPTEGGGKRVPVWTKTIEIFGRKIGG